MPTFNIQHITTYSYKGQVKDSANQIILYPIQDQFQEVLNHEIKISGDPTVDVYLDYYGNEVGAFTYSKPHNYLKIHSQITVATKAKPLPEDDIFLNIQWDELERLKSIVPYIDYLKQEYFVGLPELTKVVKPDIKTTSTPYETAMLFCKYVYENFNYIQGVTSVETTLDEVWQLKAGVCQDFAHMLLVMLRLMNIPARYVSGYICPNKNGMRGEGATHAWAEAYLPSYGWLGLDPTNNCIAGETHVRLAVGRSFVDCSPVKGVYKGALDHDLHVAVAVSYEDGTTSESPAEATPKPVSEFSKNSYMRHMELLQKEQQQQQQQ